MAEQLTHLAERRTSTDIVYDYLYQEIVTVRLLPGAKISEAEIAKNFGISRQPVRDAFARLGNDGLLLVQPQKATEVKKFSERTIARARFVRAAIEVEVLRKAATNWDGSMLDEITENVAQQETVVARDDADGFHELDYEFHKLMCQAAKAECVVDAISENKMQVDRLCVLSLLNQDAMTALLQDHRDILDQLQAGDADAVEATIRRHLSRLDKTIQTVRSAHGDYFAD